jgi:hypothetical protein
MSNYAYMLFHGFYVLFSVVCCSNISTYHMEFSGEGLSNDVARCKERVEEGHRRKEKDTLIHDDINKMIKVSCNCIVYDWYITLKNMYLFYKKLHLSLDHS